MNGARQCARALRELGVERIFAVSGDQILDLFEECDKAGIRLVHARHEAGAVYLAEGAARVSGTPAVCLVTAGPGFLTALPGLFAAAASEAPIVFLSGASAAGMRGLGAFQELDQEPLARPLCKASFAVDDPADVARVTKLAWRLAGEMVPGPVSVVLPVDVLSGETGPATSAAGRRVADEPADAPAEPPVLTVEQLSAVQVLADQMGQASSPAALVRPAFALPGQQGHLDELRTRLPVLIAESPRGVRDPLWGRERRIVEEADLLVLIGPCDYSVGLGPGPSRRLGIVTSRAAEVKTARAWAERGSCEITALVHAREDVVIDELVRRLPARLDRVPVSEPVLPTPLLASGSPAGRGGLYPLQITEAVGRFLKPEDVVVTDGGEFGQWARAGLRHHPCRHLVNGKAGAIGGAIPQAVGAALAGVAGRVWAFVGDGTFGYYCSELDTASREGVAPVVIIGNDSRWGAEWHHQLERFGPSRTVATELLWRDYDMVARGYGARAVSVASADQLADALGSITSTTQPTCINVRTVGLSSADIPA